MGKTFFHRWVRDPSVFPYLVSLYPPLLGSGIRVPRMSRDWTRGMVTIRVWPWTANPHGAAFGGALFSATDVLYGSMLAAQLGKNYEVWTKSASIDFISPGRGKLTLRVSVPVEEVNEIRKNADADGVVQANHRAAITNAGGDEIAVAHHTMFIRRRV